MCDKVLNGINVTLGGSDAKSCASIVVIGVNFPAKDVKGLHKKDVAVEGSEVKTELLVRDSDLRKL
jgi:hypothetical protein